MRAEEGLSRSAVTGKAAPGAAGVNTTTIGARSRKPRDRSRDHNTNPLPLAKPAGCGYNSGPSIEGQAEETFERKGKREGQAQETFERKGKRGDGEGSISTPATGKLSPLLEPRLQR